MNIPPKCTNLIRKFVKVELGVSGAVIERVYDKHVVGYKLEVKVPATIWLDQSRDPELRGKNWYLPVVVKSESNMLATIPIQQRYLESDDLARMLLQAGVK